MSKSTVFWFALAGFLLPATASQALNAQNDSGGDPYAVPAARMVVAFAEYTRWPSDPRLFQLCIVGSAAHADEFRNLALADGRRINARRIAATAVDAASCQLLYLGEMPADAVRGLTEKVRGKGVLTIAEADPQCRSNAMFCLQYRAGLLSFKMNLDAISRSGLKVDPRVLRLSASKGEI
ncbi:MAG: YfiR family protein [Candidatus Andeanibacterium colombiense]|uniref:YfiR family protein n=1 Tax=Candidatus Andeanibacterium colombiense TaxID=3121345 RepID=A0AAJ6BMU5_9SPHN|nr:MAG: YfiR family protein [Sphingomonadaceae bacterium]